MGWCLGGTCICVTVHACMFVCARTRLNAPACLHVFELMSRLWRCVGVCVVWCSQISHGHLIFIITPTATHTRPLPSLLSSVIHSRSCQLALSCIANIRTPGEEVLTLSAAKLFEGWRGLSYLRNVQQKGWMKKMKHRKRG